MSDGYLDYVVNKYSSKGIVVDTNLLLLLLVGDYDIELIAQFKRTNKYSAEDYVHLKKLLSYFKKIITTPYILTEVSNLSGSIGNDELKEKYYKFFDSMIGNLSESYFNSKDLSINPKFFKFGLTDCSLEELAADALVLTDDFPLYSYLTNLKLDAINYTHLIHA